MNANTQELRHCSPRATTVETPSLRSTRPSSMAASTSPPLPANDTALPAIFCLPRLIRLSITLALYTSSCVM